MVTEHTNLLPGLNDFVQGLTFESIEEDRLKVLQVLINYIQDKVNDHKGVKLNFICTHNSRRSQFSQIWGQVAANYYGVDVKCYSGGVEVTAFNERAVASIERTGFKVEAKGEENPLYSIWDSEDNDPIIAFSKVYDDDANPGEGFAAIMTCSHADENCPFIIGAEARIPVRYEDPKAFDDTDKEAEMYDARSKQIATELFYVFSKVGAEP